MRALREAMALARESGVGVAFARGSNHFGAISPYCHIAAEQGFASIGQLNENGAQAYVATGGCADRRNTAEVTDVLRTAMADQPMERYPDVESFIAALMTAAPKREPKTIRALYVSAVAVVGHCGGQCVG